MIIIFKAYISQRLTLLIPSARDQRLTLLIPSPSLAVWTNNYVGKWDQCSLTTIRCESSVAFLSCPVYDMGVCIPLAPNGCESFHRCYCYNNVPWQIIIIIQIDEWRGGSLAIVLLLISCVRLVKSLQTISRAKQDRIKRVILQDSTSQEIFWLKKTSLWLVSASVP